MSDSNPPPRLRRSRRPTLLRTGAARTGIIRAGIIRAGIIRAGLLALAAAMGFVGWFGGLSEGPNLHEVVPGVLYRSGQLSPDDLRRALRDHGIRSVVNLRGAQREKAWYGAEAAAVARSGVEMHDFSMSSRRPLAEDDADRLLSLMRDVPGPVLVHCDGGADRTGLATALYLLALRGEAASDAGRQLSPRYGHVGIRGVTGAWPMTESWHRLAPRYERMR